MTCKLTETYNLFMSRNIGRKKRTCWVWLTICLLKKLFHVSLLCMD